VLIAYCRHACRARLLEQQLRQFEFEWARVDGGLQRLDRLLQMAERESRALTAAARSLRLTPQSQVHPRTAGRALNNWPADARRPWDPD
jgi:hypothetical protein